MRGKQFKKKLFPTCIVASIQLALSCLWKEVQVIGKHKKKHLIQQVFQIPLSRIFEDQGSEYPPGVSKVTLKWTGPVKFLTKGQLGSNLIYRSNIAYDLQRPWVTFIPVILYCLIANKYFTSMYSSFIRHRYIHFRSLHSDHLDGRPWQNPYSGILGKYCGVLGKYSGILGKYSGILGKYSGILGKHSGILGKYSGILGKYSGVLGKYSGILGKYSGIMGKYSGHLGKYSGILDKYSGIFGLIQWYFGQIQWYFGQIQWYFGQIQWYFGLIRWYFGQIR